MHEIPRQVYACVHPSYPGVQAKLELSISMMTRPVAEELAHIAAPGRSAPNQAPFLPPPSRLGGGAIAHHVGGMRMLGLRPRSSPELAGWGGSAQASSARAKTGLPSNPMASVGDGAPKARTRPRSSVGSSIFGLLSRPRAHLYGPTSAPSQP